MMKDEAPDSRERTKAFALRVIKMATALPETEEARVPGRQLLRSGNEFRNKTTRIISPYFPDLAL